MYRTVAIFVLALLGQVFASLGAEPDARAADLKGVEFFEQRIRPVLVDRCYECHSARAKSVAGGLRVDTRAGLLKGGERGPAIVPGKPGESLLIQAIRQSDDLRMPPKGKLSDEVIADFDKWIATGAADPRGGTGPTPRRAAFAISADDRNHWAFRPVARPTMPAVKNARWPKSVIDSFVLAKLEARGSRPAAPADRHALLRRATFDLTGLPPTEAEIDEFLRDDSPEAFTRIVDRLLTSPSFGERWGRHWLDGVRYATSVDRGGRYRDWVIRSFNSDLPYDQFVRLQIAADLIPARETDAAKVHTSGASLDDLPATGMLALATWELVGRDLAVAEIVDSQIDVIGRQFLGLTLACARCHDHKFDPFSNEDYFGLAGIFFSSHISPGKLIADDRLSGEVIEIPLISRVDAEQFQRFDAEIAALRKQMESLEAQSGPAARLYHVRAEVQKLAAELPRATGAAKKELEKKLAAARGAEAKLLADKTRLGWREDPPELVAAGRLRQRVAELDKAKVRPVTIGIQEGGVPGSDRQRIGDAPIYLRGDHRRKGQVVPRRFPVIFAGDRQTPLGQRTNGSGRLELANWIASADHSLTARVMVNRVWQHLFGQGLVRTPDNFGRLGETPTHPQLLDHLAARFVASGWSVKQLIREIMLSATYQQSSLVSAESMRADPENRLIGRMTRKRLEYEALRDSLLFAADQLARDTAAATRRTVYEPIDRKQGSEMRATFDGADPLGIVPLRASTTTTPQALFLMNDALVIDSAAAISQRLRNDATLPDDRARVTRAYRFLLGRAPATDEMQIGIEYVGRNGWNRYVQVLLCTNEFMYLD